jgi:hypothetical protein
MPQLPRHRWNPGRDLDWNEVWDSLDAAGGVIVEGFIADELLGRLRSDFHAAVEAHKPGSSSPEKLWIDFHGANTKRVTGLAGRSPAWAELLCDPHYTELGDRYLGKDDYYLNTAQLICIGPGETPQLLHRDALNWPQVAMNDGEVTITAIFALTDFTEENGATVLAPFSHTLPGVLPHVEPEQCCQAVMPAGSALLYSGKVIHGGGANRTSDQWRVGLHAGFLSGWLRAEENHQVPTPLVAAARLPERVQRLLGFRAYEPEFGGRLGLVDYDDPARLL